MVSLVVIPCPYNAKERCHRLSSLERIGVIEFFPTDLVVDLYRLASKLDSPTANGFCLKPNALVDV